MSAPDYIHKLVDLAWNGGSEFKIMRHATVGETWSAGYERSRWFTVDVTEEEKWTVTVPQPQPPINPALVLSLEEYQKDEG